jgi:hypothetical protein
MKSEAVNDLNRPHRPRAGDVIHYMVASLLLAAAILKTYPALQADWHMDVWPRLLNLGLIEFELFIAFLLFLNLRPTWGWALAVIAFTIFAGVSAKNAAAGAKGCGCFGPATIDPKIMAVVDVLIVAALIATGPRSPSANPAGRGRRAAGVAIVGLMLLGVGATVYSAIPKRGLIAAENGIHNFGVLTPATAICEHAFVVENTGSRPIRITRSSSSCGCTVARTPAEPIPPGGSAVVTVRADWSKGDGHTISRVVLYTDGVWTPEVVLLVTGEVLAAPATAPATAPGAAVAR